MWTRRPRSPNFFRPPVTSCIPRPRRFGKNLLLSTIEAVYSGNKSLFGGDGSRPALATSREGVWEWPDHPVLRLDMLEVGRTAASMERALNGMLATAAKVNMRGTYDHDPESPDRIPGGTGVGLVSAALCPGGNGRCCYPGGRVRLSYPQPNALTW